MSGLWPQRSVVLASLLALCSTAGADDFERFTGWIEGRWDNEVQARNDIETGVPKSHRHPRYPMDYIRVPKPGLGGVVFAIHNYDATGFDGELRRVGLHRFARSTETGEIVHQFLFIRDGERFGPRPGELDLLAELTWDDVKTNSTCNMYWRWMDDRFVGTTRPGSCVTSSFTPEPILIEGRGELWPDRLSRHDQHFTLEGEPLERDGGHTPEIFIKAD